MTHLLARLKPQSYQPLPYFIEKVAAGFPSPADGYQDSSIDLNELCISHPNATFLVRASGLSMIDAGIHPNDLLIVDRSLEASTGDIVVCSLHGQFTVKELSVNPPKLIAHNPNFMDINLNPEDDFEIFGVVTNIIRDMKNRKHRQSKP